MINILHLGQSKDSPILAPITSLEPSESLPWHELFGKGSMKRLPYDHRDRTLRILASKGGIMTLMELRRSMGIKRENLERILHELGMEGRIVRTTGKQGIESITLVKRL